MLGPVTSLSMMALSATRWAARHLSRSAALGIVLRSPLTTTALRFFIPATVPVPPRPETRSSSLTKQENSTPFSPAWPIAMTERFLP